MLHSKDKITAFSKTRSLQFADKILLLQKPVVMGILNITPDSFYDGGKHLEKEKYLAAAAEMLQDGAAILDLGAVSTRPGAREVSEEEELENEFGREVTSEQIGERVMRHLRKLDEIAYVRFASVYRQFHDAEQFIHEIQRMVKNGRPRKSKR